MRRSFSHLILAAAFIVTALVYWPGVKGGFVFDDYPNIVDNKNVQPTDASLPSLIRVALSSPSSEFKRPLASLSFAANYLTTGINPYWMKLTNLVIHLLNGWLIFLLARALLRVGGGEDGDGELPHRRRRGMAAALVAGSWLLLPINLTGVLYVVQRMESMANLFVLLGLVGYVAGRRRMLATATHGGLMLCIASITLPVLIGVLAKETAVMLPLYALLIEWALFRFQRRASVIADETALPALRATSDWRIAALYVVVLALPLVAGLVWLLPSVLSSGAWASRNFTLGTRLLTEARVVTDYIGWTVVPTPDALSFYHDDFSVSTGLLKPWTTLASLFALAALVCVTFWLRKRQPIAALGLALFLGCQTLTATILPLELVYEHRNYFASFGLMLALVPWLAGVTGKVSAPADAERIGTNKYVTNGVFFALPRRTLLGCLIAWWTVSTGMTAVAWSSPLRLAQELAARAPDSPRTQYELGRTYIVYSQYDPASPFTLLAYAPLEHAAELPGSSILPQQALIFLNSRMHRPVKDAWWDSMIAKLRARVPGVQDESSLSALTQCVREHACDLPPDRMTAAFLAALSHPSPGARLLATYGDYAWNVLDDHVLGERMTREAVAAAPNEPAYRITLIRMLAAQGQVAEARQAIAQLATLNIGGRLNDALAELHTLRGLQ